MILTPVQSILDRNIVPDFALRIGIRHLLSRRLSEEQQKEVATGDTYKTDFVEMLKASPIALSTRTANEQHYEVPDDYFKLVLGSHLKYSSGYWASGCHSLEDAESAMLALTCERAAIQDGESVLELGCGWGSLTLFLAQTFPNSAITAVSNSSTQKEYIEQQAAARGLTNITVITSDMNDFQVEQQFDRVASVEMFEHMRNYQKLLARISGWVKPGGTLFVHIFSHRYFAYTFDVDGSGQNWMAENFFTDGLMPSDDLLLHFQDHFAVKRHWNVSGLHYHKTLEAWIDNHKQRKTKILELFGQTYGPGQALPRWVAWKIFFLACSELFRYNDGREWGVSHYLFEKRYGLS
jgi:cyclopropane-fatty-acyl-phospholipid synthase